MNYKIIIVVASLFIGVTVVLGAVFINNNSNSNDVRSSVTITDQELESADGKNGNKCYVAIDETVYEIKQGNEWKEGEHIPSENQAYCGADLTNVISDSPHGKSILSILTEIGTLN